QAASARPASHPPGFDPAGGETDPGRTDPGRGPAGGTAPTASGTTSSQRTSRVPARPSVQPSGGGRPPVKGAPPSARDGVPAGGDAEGAVVALTNAERVKAGCKPLRPDARLATAARKHSAEMLSHGYFEHGSRNGDSPWKRMEDAGYASPGAENIAKGYTTAEAVVASWMKSSGHRANILNCDLRATGVGMAAGPGGPLWTQDFGWK
ncbi:CAP domain-containing protein, partial [Actinomadura roseirufa]|uniref:CAP domain-containing protein n=1 Tax=Actinomadura roseirufa TaxID=2094049 RepID=UPI001040EC2B